AGPGRSRPRRHARRCAARQAGRAGVPPAAGHGGACAQGGQGGQGGETALITLGGKVCVVTGALGLIGNPLARALAEAGGRVVLTDLDHGACVDRAQSLGGGGGDALGHGADITRPESLASLLAAILDRFGQIDGLVNSAAIGDKFGGSAPHESMFEHYDLERWRKVLEANVTGTFLC